jgi:Lrp/AsnC family transcriptional regulator, leucine-responsive regulatory protein
MTDFSYETGYATESAAKAFKLCSEIRRLCGGEDIMLGPAKLDAKDRKLLQLLQNDGRISNQALSDKVGLSASACLARVRRLESDGLIRGYRADIAVERLQPQLTLFAELTLSSHDPRDFDKVERALSLRPEVIEAHQISGRFDYLIKVTVAHVDAWRAFSDSLLSEVPVISKINSHIAMKPCKAVQVQI